MLKRDGFQPTDPMLFNAALASASATLSQTTRSSAAGSTFVRAKHWDMYMYFVLCYCTSYVCLVSYTECYLRPTVLFNFIIFITAWNLRFRSAAYAGCHGNFRSVVLP